MYCCKLSYLSVSIQFVITVSVSFDGDLESNAGLSLSMSASNLQRVEKYMNRVKYRGIVSTL